MSSLTRHVIQVHKFTCAKARGLVEMINLDQPGGEKFEEKRSCPEGCTSKWIFVSGFKKHLRDEHEHSDEKIEKM